MLKRILNYKDNIICSVGILAVLSLVIASYSGVKEGYFNIFLLAIIIAPALIIMKAKNSLKADFTFASVMVLIIVLYAIVFWRYKDGSLFSLTDISEIPEEARSQFSFENELKIGLLFAWSLASTLISSLIRFAYSRLKMVKA